MRDRDGGMALENNVDDGVDVDASARGEGKSWHVR